MLLILDSIKPDFLFDLHALNVTEERYNGNSHRKLK